ncbi:MAG: Oar protein [Acidobacteriaceae bacterium]|nr:Oar protein [Acidobacteriaceae bacterium]
MRFWKVTRLLAGFFLLFAGLAFGQTITSGTVVGSVTDATGAVIPNASVTIQQAESGIIQTTKTNESGQYRFPFLEAGRVHRIC